MKSLFVLNDPPYGSERVYNGLRLAGVCSRATRMDRSRSFLVGDAVTGATRGQKTPGGYCNVERMLHRVVVGKGQVLVCGSCMDARGIMQGQLMEGARRSSMDELGAATLAADKVLVF